MIEKSSWLGMCSEKKEVIKDEYPYLILKHSYIAYI